MKQRASTKIAVACVCVLITLLSGVFEAKDELENEVRNSGPFTEAIWYGEAAKPRPWTPREKVGFNSGAATGFGMATESETHTTDDTASEISRRGRTRSLRAYSSSRGRESRGALDTSPDRRRALQAKADDASCPLDFRGMREFPWFVQSCKVSPDDYNSSCCPALLYALGQAEAEYLRSNGEFRVKDEATFGACMETLTDEIFVEGASDAASIVPACFPRNDYFKYVNDPSHCQGIMTTADFERVVGPADVASLDAACSGSLADVEICQSCSIIVTNVVDKLNAISPNMSDCNIYTFFYAGGISNFEGPYSTGAAHCIFKVTIFLPDNRHNLALDVSLGAVSAFFASLAVVASVCAWRRRKRGAVHREFIERNTTKLKAAMRPNMGLIQYKFDELKAATKNFSSKNFIGSGGFGEVYKGVLEDGLEVAVKRMKNCSEELDTEFVNEVDVINSVRHRNLVVLRGCCVASTPSEGHQRLLVYDYMPNGSLYDFLFGDDKPVLTWPERRSVAIDMAKGIAYLHNATRPPIIHRDIKSANILLDENLNARVTDFGLAKFTIEGQTHVSTTNVAGTMGYVAPEYVLYNHITEKSDVYSFGVVLLELMSGHRALEGTDDELPDSGFSLITDWARGTAKEGTLLDIVDERIRNVGPRDVMEKFVHMAMLCCHQLVLCRPSMEEVLQILESEIPMPGTTSNGSMTQLDINYLLHSGFTSYEWYSETTSTGNPSMSEFSDRSAGSELLR